MTDPFPRLRRFLRELKRRNVYRVAVTYAAVVFVTLQAARLVFPATTLEGLYDELVVIAFVGFPIAVVIAWAFELTPEGVRRTPNEDPKAGPAESASSGLGGWIAALVILLVAGGGFWYLTAGGGEEPATEFAASAGTALMEARLSGRSIAVLPFEVLGQREPDAFTEGMHDDLLTRLSNVAGLQVISRTSVQQYRDTEKTADEVARELGVRWVLEGGVQKMGDRIQVNAQLIDPRTDTHAWAATYRRDLTARDLFELQAEITHRIARSLKARLTPEETERVERQPTEDLDAYRLYVQGRRQLERRTEQGMREAVGSFQQSVERDSSYALAWAGLADAYTHLGGYGHVDKGTVFPLAWDAARRALQLNPDLAEAHASLGNLHIWRYEGPTALRELELAVELQPSLAHAHDQLGFLLLILGRAERAQEHASLAQVLNPMSPSPPTVLAGVYLAEGEYEKVLESARRAQELQPNYAIAHMLEFAALYRLERWEEVRDVAGRDPPSDVKVHRLYRRVDLALLDVAEGETARARQRLERLIERDAIPYGQGLIHAALGNEEAALAAFDEMVEEAGPWETINLRYFRSNVLGSLRDDPRYTSLLRKLNRTWGLNPDGSLPDGVDVSFGSPGDADA